MTIVGAFGALFLKKASTSKGTAAMLKNVHFYFGGACYALSAVLNVYLLRFMPYNVLLPLTSLTYIWTAFIGVKILHEAISSRTVFGIALIIIGVSVLVTA